jgi:penicillin-binding protein 1A
MHPIFNVAIAAGMIFAGALGLAFRQVEVGLPDISGIVDYHSPVGQVFVPLTAIPTVVVHAFLAAEDVDFYRHGAVDFPMMLRAIGLDILRFDRGRRPLGASTITQQLVKNLIVDDKLSINRKIREAILAFRFERLLSKDRILEIYLNEVHLGCHSRGVTEAALNYFSKPATELSIDEAEAATLKAEPVRLGADQCGSGSDGDEANCPAKVVGVSGDTDRLLTR